MLSPTYEITTALSHTDELISPPYDIAIVTISYGRVTMSSVWDSMMSKKNMGWPFYAAVKRGCDTIRRILWHSNGTLIKDHYTESVSHEVCTRVGGLGNCRGNHGWRVAAGKNTFLILFFIPPPPPRSTKLKGRGHSGFTLSVRLSVCPSVSKFKDFKFWQILKICNFDFVLFWLGIEYELVNSMGNHAFFQLWRL